MTDDVSGPMSGAGPDLPLDALGGPADLVQVSREAIRTLHLVARELDDAAHARCLHLPLTTARDATLALAVRLQMALRDNEQ